MESFRVIVVEPGTSRILVSSGPSGFRLPALEIPAQIRQAGAIGARLPAVIGFDAYCLFVLPEPRSVTTPWNYMVASACDRGLEPAAPLEWVAVRSPASEQFADPGDGLATDRALDEMERHSRDQDHAFFGRPGWLAEIVRWAGQAIEPRGMQLSGRFEQWNASPSTSLLRLPTGDSAVWFKAAGDSDLQELRITRYLARHFPAFVPELIAEHEASRGWLLAETPGAPPGRTSPAEAWIAASAALAELEIASLGHTLHLARAGCRDMRPEALPDLVDPFLDAVAHLMELQPRPSPPPLGRAALDELKSVLLDAIESLAKLELPAALGHLDFNTGNILVHGDRVAFLDWASGCVGSPFVTHEYLLEQLRTLRPAEHGLAQNALAAYTRKWEALLGEEEMSAALAVTPLVAAFCYAAGSDAWREPSRLREPDTAGHLRSITRRMKKEAERWASGAGSHRSRSLSR